MHFPAAPPQNKPEVKVVAVVAYLPTDHSSFLVPATSDSSPAASRFWFSCPVMIGWVKCHEAWSGLIQHRIPMCFFKEHRIT
jgi:hypothetical protein